MHAEAAMEEGIQRVEDGGGVVVEIGEDDDGAAAAKLETGASARGGERGGAARGVVFEGGEDVVQMLARAANTPRPHPRRTARIGQAEFEKSIERRGLLRPREARAVPSADDRESKRSQGGRNAGTRG